MSVKAAKRDFARATREAERAVIAGWHELEDAYDTATDRGQELAGSARDWGSEVAGSARDLAGSARDRAMQARERANDARDRAYRAANRGQDLVGTARDRAGTARDRAADARDRVLGAQREAWRRGEAARDALAGRRTHQRRNLFLVAAAGVGAGAAIVIGLRRWAAAKERAQMEAMLPDIDDIEGEDLPDFPPTAPTV